MSSSTFQESYAETVKIKREIDDLLNLPSHNIASKQRLTFFLKDFEKKIKDMKSLTSSTSTSSNNLHKHKLESLAKELELLKMSCRHILSEEKDVRAELFGDYTNHPNGEDDDAVNHMFNERSHLNDASSSLDNYISQGLRMVDSIQSQNQILKSANKKVLDLMNMSGINSKLIKSITGRETTDENLICGCLLMVIILILVLWWYF
jgi:Snare region anchored in the vesicle membrane C-terminus